MRVVMCVVLGVVLMASVLADVPIASVSDGKFIIPFTTDGKEYPGDAEADVDGMYFYVTEYDPDYEVKMWREDRYTIRFEFARNPTRVIKARVPMEVCLSKGELFDMPGFKVGTPKNCKGETSILIPAVDFEKGLALKTKSDTKHFSFFLGDGAGGGGDIGCILQPFCEILDLGWSDTGSSTNTETSFTVKIDALMTTSAGCECTVYLKHKATTQYATMATTYPSFYTYAVGKVTSGANPRTITGTTIVTWTTQCGGMHGNMYLQGVGAPATAITKTIACTDAVPPLIEQQSPANLSNFAQPLINLTCNATDNTALRAIRLWDNRTGHYVNTGNQTYTYRTLTATKTFNMNYAGKESAGIGWYCEAEDTRTPTNDAIAGLRYFNYTEPPAVVVPSETMGGSVYPPLGTPANPSDEMVYWLFGMLCLTMALAFTMGRHERKNEGVR